SSTTAASGRCALPRRAGSPARSPSATTWKGFCLHNSGDRGGPEGGAALPERFAPDEDADAEPHGQRGPLPDGEAPDAGRRAPRTPLTALLPRHIDHRSAGAGRAAGGGAAPGGPHLERVGTFPRATGS